MASAREWFEGARPRTLPAAVAPVCIGAGLAVQAHCFDPLLSLLALLVAICLQIGVNYANDYSDGVRGTDERRVGPVRLVGQRLASGPAVRAAAIASLALGALFGLAIVVLVGNWWLLLIGGLCLVAAWLYTGGPHPYGYSGFGEASVLVFFGLVPVLGTFYIQSLRITAASVLAGLGIGLLTCAILLANNIRDIPSDAPVGKRTLAVRLGDRAARWLFLLVLAAPFALLPLICAALEPPAWWPLAAMVAAPPAWVAARTIRSGALGRALIPVLQRTSLAVLVYGLVLGAALALS